LKNSEKFIISVESAKVGLPMDVMMLLWLGPFFCEGK
jgi:hypothetical protein